MEIISRTVMKNVMEAVVVEPIVPNLVEEGHLDLRKTNVMVKMNRQAITTVNVNELHNIVLRQ